MTEKGEQKQIINIREPVLKVDLLTRMIENISHWNQHNHNPKVFMGLKGA